MRFWKDNASYPYQSHDLWFLTEDIRWGKYGGGLRRQVVDHGVSREDLEGRPPRSLVSPLPTFRPSTSRGKETFFDGKVFDPENPAAYLKSLSIKRVDV